MNGQPALVGIPEEITLMKVPPTQQRKYVRIRSRKTLSGA
jgi:hypothetical protein